MYSERVLVGYWFDNRQLELEKRELLAKKRADGQMLYQRIRRLARALNGPIFGLHVRGPSEEPLRFGQAVQLQCPEVEELAYVLEAQTGCPWIKMPPGPGRMGLFLAATASLLEAERGTTERIGDECPLACTPDREPSRRSVFILRSADSQSEEPLRFGQEVFFQLAYIDIELFVRSEVPLLDGIYTPNDHYPVRLNLSKDGYTKWKVLHWNKNKRFETEGSPVLPCMRVVIQHVMTGQCLAAENYDWHHSILGFECSASVHSYRDIYRNETSNCIWNMLVVEKIDEDCKNIKYLVKCNE